MSFESNTIGLFYINSLDHSCRPGQMFGEVFRCLKPGSYFINDFFPGHMGRYEACRIDSAEDVNSAMPLEMRLYSHIPHLATLTKQFADELIFKKSK